MIEAASIGQICTPTYLNGAISGSRGHLGLHQGSKLPNIEVAALVLVNLLESLQKCLKLSRIDYRKQVKQEEMERLA